MRKRPSIACGNQSNLFFILEKNRYTASGLLVLLDFHQRSSILLSCLQLAEARGDSLVGWHFPFPGLAWARPPEYLQSPQLEKDTWHFVPDDRQLRRVPLRRPVALPNPTIPNSTQLPRFIDFGNHRTLDKTLVRTQSLCSNKHRIEYVGHTYPIPCATLPSTSTVSNRSTKGAVTSNEWRTKSILVLF